MNLSSGLGKVAIDSHGMVPYEDAVGSKQTRLYEECRFRIANIHECV